MNHSSNSRGMLAAYYFFYFATVGVLVPYMARYFEALNFDEVAVGKFIAIVTAGKLVAPFFWGWLADKTGRPVHIVRISSTLCFFGFLPFFVADQYWHIVVLLALFSMFWNASLPIYEAITLANLGEQSHRYTYIRVWGSISFILATIGAGVAQDMHGEAAIMPIAAVALAGVMVCAWLQPEVRPIEHHEQAEAIGRVLLRPEVMGLFVICFLMQFSHAPYYTFFTSYLRESGYNFTETGFLWALGVLPEVFLFLLLPRLLRRYGSAVLLFWALVLTAIRWYLVAQFVDQVWVLAGSQILHLASYGLYHGAAIALIHRFFVKNNQGRGQALYGALSFGLGGVLGAWLCGLGWKYLGAEAVFEIAAVSTLLGVVILLLIWSRLQQTSS